MQHVAENEQLDLFDAGRWPKRPYCSDDKTARYIRPLATALTLPYIQANPPHLRVWSIFDIDRPRGAIAWEEAHLPPPSWSSANRENGHAHLVWGLTVPVLVDAEEARQAPLRYLCAVESAFREKLEADTGFAGLITKNPAHPLWKTLRGPRVAYGLGELAEWVDLPRHLPKKKPEQIGLGRNVTLFDWLRHWAYKAIRRQETRNFVLWQQACYQKALDRNGEFTHPLDSREVHHIAKSVAKWVYRHMSAEGWAEFVAKTHTKEIQAARGKKGGVASGQARREAASADQAAAVILRAQGLNNSEIARRLGVPRSTVIRWLSAKDPRNEGVHEA